MQKQAFTEKKQQIAFIAKLAKMNSIASFDIQNHDMISLWKVNICGELIKKYEKYPNIAEFEWMRNGRDLLSKYA